MIIIAIQKTHCPQKGISLLPDHHVLSASRRTNSEPRLTVFHSTFASAYTAHLRYEPCCFGCLCFGLFVCWLVLSCCALFWCLARISLVSLFNSIKVTCASRHLHPCKKKVTWFMEPARFMNAQRWRTCKGPMRAQLPLLVRQSTAQLGTR